MALDVAGSIVAEGGAGRPLARVRGFLTDLDSVLPGGPELPPGSFSAGRARGRGILVTGTSDWGDITLQGRMAVAVADAAGLVVRYRSLGRFLALVLAGRQLQLVLVDGEPSVLARRQVQWQPWEFHDMALTCLGDEVTVTCDGADVLAVDQPTLPAGGGAGVLVDTGRAMFAGLSVAPPG